MEYRTIGTRNNRDTLKFRRIFRMSKATTKIDVIFAKRAFGRLECKTANCLVKYGHSDLWQQVGSPILRRIERRIRADPLSPVVMSTTNCSGRTRIRYGVEHTNELVRESDSRTLRLVREVLSLLMRCPTCSPLESTMPILLGIDRGCLSSTRQK